MSVLSGFVIEQIQQYEYADISAIFDTIEEFLVSGPQELRNAVATCFLESLLNATPNQLEPASFVSLLGPLSQDYCRAWDKFTEVKTLGLW